MRYRQTPRSAGQAAGLVSGLRNEPDVRWRRRSGSEVVIVADLQHPVAFFLIGHRIVGRNEGELSAVGTPRVLLHAARGVGDAPGLAAARRQNPDLTLRVPITRGVGQKGE